MYRFALSAEFFLVRTNSTYEKKNQKNVIQTTVLTHVGLDLLIGYLVDPYVCEICITCMSVNLSDNSIWVA